MESADAVLFISFGGPEKQEDILPFLENVTRGRGIPPARLSEVARHYEAIGGKSPLNEITRRQAAAVRDALAAAGTPLPVYIGQRHCPPFLDDTLRRMAADGIRKAIGFPTAAHRCEASLERYVNAVEAARAKVGPAAPVIEYVGPWFDHPLFIQAIAARIDEALQKIPAERRARTEWIYTAHSIPCAMAKDSTYVSELRRTAALVGIILGQPAGNLAYSSRSGNPREAWLEPDVCDAIRAAARRGAQDVLLVPIGFVADHVEVLFDLDVEAREAAEAAGVTLTRARTVGDHPDFVRLMIDVIRRRQRMDERSEQRSSLFTIYQDGSKEERPGAASTECYCRPESVEPPCRRVASIAAGSQGFQA